MCVDKVLQNTSQTTPSVFTRNTRDSSGLNLESKARGIYTWTVECITRKHWWGVVWLPCTTAGIQIIIVLFFCLYCVLFLPNQNTLLSNFWQQIPHIVGCIPANKPLVASCFFARLYCALLCYLTTQFADSGCSNYRFADSVWFADSAWSPQYNHIM